MADMWAVFSERGMIWTDTIRKTRRASIAKWMKQNRDAEKSARKWRYWYRAGYRCDRITVLRHGVRR